MAKKKAVLNLGHAPVSEVVLKANVVIKQMTDNDYFITPTPTLADIAAQLEILDKAIAEQKVAEKTAIQKTMEMHDEKDKLTDLLLKICNYVTNEANGSENIILSSGLDVKKTPAPIGLLPAPKSVRALAGNNSGEIIGRWNKVKGAGSYNVELSTDIKQTSAWSHITTVTKSKCTIKKLTSGTSIWLRVVAINAAGKGAYSGPAPKTVP
ncbi:MAG TPA: fibronectin type III domain-containing protein [Chitinophagales bacterium]|nr:fibronectin type III domain-containing protein [Chitinophagales bacterium]